MLKVINTTVYNDDKLIKTFDNAEDAESFKNAASFMIKRNESKKNKFYTSINEFRKNLK